MNFNRKNLINLIAVVAGILALAVLVLPWYSLESHSSWGMDAYGGTTLGFAAAGTSFFGYALYILPILTIGLAANNPSFPLTSKAKCLCLELIGAVEFACLMFLQMSMNNYDVDVSSFGMSIHSGFEPTFGITVASVVYIATAVVGFIAYFIAPKEDPATLAAPAAEDTTPPTDNVQ